MGSERSDWKGDELTLNRQLGILAAAVKVETYGRDFYLRMSECVRDKEGKLILKSLAEDEQEHRVWLTRQIDRIFPGKDVSTITPDPRYAGIVPQKVFPDLAPGAVPLRRGRDQGSGDGHRDREGLRPHVHRGRRPGQGPRA